MRNQSHRRFRNGGAGIVALLALAAIAAGCGGSGSDPAQEAALRKKLAAAAQKLTDAKSFSASLVLEAVEGGEVENLGCIVFSIDNHRKPERVRLAFFGEECTGELAEHELVAIGRRAWASTTDRPDTWREARIAPALLDELDEERTDLKGLIAAAEDIGETSEDEEAEGAFPGGASYKFTAPASAFPGSESDFEDVEVEFTASVDSQGFLNELVVLGGIEDTTASVTEKYDAIDRFLAISPPDPAEVHGKTTTIRTQADLDRLFGF